MLKRIMTLTLVTTIILLTSFFMFGRTPLIEPPVVVEPESFEEPDPVPEPESEPEPEPEPEPEHENLEQEINDYLENNNIEHDQISIVVTNLNTMEEIIINNQMPFRAASTYKLPLAMLYYDEINANNLSLEDLYILEEQHFEEGGPLLEYYGPGDYIDLQTLLSDMIQFSDNTAAHLLYQSYGGWNTYRNDALRYTDKEVDDSFFEPENYFTTQYTNDLLVYLYQFQDNYELLLNDMANSFPTEYLNETMPYSTYQKHGNYDIYYSAIGLVLDENPYTISIFTTLGYNGKTHIGQINQLVHEYLN